MVRGAPPIFVGLDAQGGQLVTHAFAQRRVTIHDFMRTLSAARLPRNEARLLLAHVLHRNHAWLVAHDDYAPSDDELAQISALAARRIAGEPVAYLIGEREFYGRVYRCSPASLIPRPETELLIEQALHLLSIRPRIESGASAERIEGSDRTSLRILDVGTGTGCIAITLALERPNAVVTAIDISSAALALARDNATRLGANLTFIESNWFSALVPTHPKFDLIVSNPPYIVPADPHLSQGDLRFEPAIALTDAVDGLESYRQLARGAQSYLRAGGVLLVEHGYDQGESVPALLAACGLVNIVTHHDLAGHPRVTAAQKRRSTRGRSKPGAW